MGLGSYFRFAGLTLNLLVSSVVTFANSLNPDQDRQNVGPDLHPNHLPLLWYFRNNFLKKLILKKISRQKQKLEKLSSKQRANGMGVSEVAYFLTC